MFIYFLIIKNINILKLFIKQLYYIIVQPDIITV